jgi:hypothetical protein
MDLTFRTGKGIKQLKRTIIVLERDPFFTHPQKLQESKDKSQYIDTEKAEHLGEFNDILSGARLPKVQKACMVVTTEWLLDGSKKLYSDQIIVTAVADGYLILTLFLCCQLAECSAA